MICAYIGIGSNLDDPQTHVVQAIEDLNTITDTLVRSHSPLYSSAALGPKQPDYTNAVVCIDTDLPAQNLLSALQVIEAKHGRQRTVRWGPRTLDLDILLYGDEIISSANLTIPHDQLKKRNFVLYPLYDLTPKLTLPCGTSIGTLVAQCPSAGLSKL
jgi:2-amino-4-hydroxy-6-hydroxymethyldihydropteridine diphosphokinase